MNAEENVTVKDDPPQIDPLDRTGSCLRDSSMFVKRVQDHIVFSIILYTNINKATPCSRCYPGV